MYFEINSQNLKGSKTADQGAVGEKKDERSLHDSLLVTSRFKENNFFFFIYISTYEIFIYMYLFVI